MLAALYSLLCCPGKGKSHSEPCSVFHRGCPAAEGRPPPPLTGSLGYPPVWPSGDIPPMLHLTQTV